MKLERCPPDPDPVESVTGAELKAEQVRVGTLQRRDANDLPNSEQAVKTKPKLNKSFSIIFHRF